jgi:hypothetical protein
MIIRFSFLAVLMLLLDDALKLVLSLSKESPATDIKYGLKKRYLLGRALGKASEEEILHYASKRTLLDVPEVSETDRDEIEDSLEAMKQDAEGIQYLRREYYNADSFLSAVARVKRKHLELGILAYPI